MLTARGNERRDRPLVELVHRLEVPATQTQCAVRQQALEERRHCSIPLHHILDHVQTRIRYHLYHMSILPTSHPRPSSLPRRLGDRRRARKRGERACERRGRP